MKSLHNSQTVFKSNIGVHFARWFAGQFVVQLLDTQRYNLKSYITWTTLQHLLIYVYYVLRIIWYSMQIQCPPELLHSSLISLNKQTHLQCRT